MKNNHRKTRAMYVKYLNETCPQYTDNMKYLLTKTKRPALMRARLDSGMYGQILKRHDPIAFNVGYNEWSQ